MATQLEENNQEVLDLQRYVEIIRRRHLWFLVPLFAGWLVVFAASWFVTPKYKSGTLILVEQPTMPKDYVTPNVNDDLQERLQSITQQILSRTRLMHIVDELNLYSKDNPRRNPEAQVDKMRKDIEIDLVKDTDNRVTAFNVYYTARDPIIAQQVTSKLTNLFINENLEVRQQQSEDTTKFLEDQLESARQSLAAQEDQMRNFKGAHVGELPAQLGSNLQILGGLQSQLQAAEDALNTARQQHVYLQSLVDQYRAMPGGTKSSDATGTDLASVQQQLDKEKTDLRNMSAVYKEQYPEIRKLKEQIAKTEKLRDQLLAEQKNKSKDPKAVSDAAVVAEASDSRNSAMLLQLQSQLQANQTEIKNREQSISELKAKIDAYQSRLNQEPIREQQLTDLARGYEQSKASYDELLKKKNQSAMATSMELLQQGERFRILDPPSLPTKPSFPNRLKFCAMGLAAGLFLGLGTVIGLEVMNDQIYSEKELKDLLPTTVLSEIPIITTPEKELAERQRIRRGWMAAAVVFAVILAGSAASYFIS